MPLIWFTMNGSSPGGRCEPIICTGLNGKSSAVATRRPKALTISARLDPFAGRSADDEAQQEQHQKQRQDAHAVEGRRIAEFDEAGIGRGVFHADEDAERERDQGHDLRALRRCAGDQKRRGRDHHDGDQRPGYCTNELGQHVLYLNLEAGSSNFVVFESVRCVSHSVQNCVKALER
jgi:hypothetical protein